MVKSLLILLVFSQVCQAQYLGIKQPIPEIDTVNFVGKVNVFVGDSETFGFGLSDTTKRYANIFSKYHGAIEQNIAANGKYLQFSSICTGAYNRFDKTTIPTYVEGTHACLFIALGVNDIALNTIYSLQPTTPARFALTMDTSVDYAISTAGWPHRRVVIVTPFWWSDYSIHDGLSGCGHVAADATLHQQYVDAALQVASLRKCTSIDIYTAIKNDAGNASYLQADKLHYNDAGNIAIANFFKTITYLK